MNCTLAPLFATAVLFASTEAAAASAPVRTDHLQSQLVAAATAAVPGETLALGLLLEHDPHWHTYWRNPGDSGLPTEIEFVLPDGVVAEPIAWPHPHRFEIAEIANFGFEGRQLLPVTIAVPADYAGATLPVRAKAKWLICEEECIPGKAEYVLDLPVAPSAAPDARWAGDFAAARHAQPHTADAPLDVSHDGEHIVLTLADPAATPARWTWFPETPNVVRNAAGPQWQRMATGWQARWPKSEYFTALPPDVAFVAVDEDAAGTGASAWRFAGIAAANAATPGDTSPANAATAGVAAPSGAATADRAPDDRPFGRVPVLLMAIAAVLFAATIALVIRASSRRAPPVRSEETDR